MSIGRRRRALILSYYFPPMNDVAVLRAFYFARHLPTYGYDPIVVTATSSTDLNSRVLAELPATCTVLRVKDWYRWSMDLSPGALLTALRARRSLDFDIVLGTGPTWSSLKTALFVAKLARRPLIADIRDPWTYGYMWEPRGRIHAAIQRRWERAVMRQARRIIYVDPLETRKMRGSVPKELAQKMVTITHGHEDADRPGRRSAGSDKCTFCHLGKLHPKFRRPELLFEAFRLACEDPGFERDARLFLYGDPAGFETLIEGSELKQRIIFRGVVSQSEAAEYMHGADILVLFQLVRREQGDMPTLKVFEYLAARRPILGIAPKGGTAGDLIQSTKNSLLVGQEDPRTIADGMLTLWQRWRSGTLAAHSLDLSAFTRARLTGQLAELFDQVLAEPS